MRTLIALLAVLAAAPLPAAPSEIEERVLRHVDEAARDGLGAEDFHHLVFAFGWRETLPDWKVVGDSLARLSEVPRTDPLMVDELRLLRAQLAVDVGRPAEAREVFENMGGLSRWWALGPESIDELEDFPAQAVLPPADSEWREASGTDPMGWLQLRGLAWPARRQMLYLATTVTSERAQPVALRVGVAQCARVWLNGVDVLTTARPLAHAEDQAVAGGWLEPGENSLVVAVASESADWWVRMRVTAPDGSGLDGVYELATPPVTVTAAERETPDVSSLELEIRRALERGEDGAALALAAFMVTRSPYPVDAGEARAACRAARESSPALARMLEWLITSEPTTARTLLEEALAADADLTWARVELARWLHARGLFEDSRRVLSLPSADPFLSAASLDLDALRWGSMVIPGLAEIFDANPAAARVGVILAGRALDGKRWGLAERTMARLQAFVPGLEDVVEISTELTISCGDADSLVERLRHRLEVDPNQPGLRVRLSRLLVAAGEPDAGLRVLDEGLARCPDHADLMIEAARLEHVGGRDARAAELATRLLELRPQDRRAERLLTLIGAGEDQREWRRSTEELWKMAAEAPQDAPAVALLDHVELRFLPANLTEERVQRVYLVRNSERSGFLFVQPLAYVPERHRLRVLAARVLRPDGSEVSARQNDTPRLSEPEINIFYDTRLRVLRFADVEDGDLIEIAYVLTETAEANETGPYKGGLLRFDRRVPVQLAEVRMSGPEDSLPAWELAHLEGEPERKVLEDGDTLLSWSWSGLPALQRDVPAAPELLVTPHLAYSNHPDWGDLAEWYGKHVATRVRRSRLVEETAERLTNGVVGRLQRIARIYRFVTDEIRYVGLEFGEHRFRPFPADWVLNHKIGDCKDKAALLVALLGAAGVPAEMVMVRIADVGPVATSIALLETFNHAIVYLPEDDLWLDGTATGHDPYPPPTMDQGAWVLAVRGADSRPETTPRPGGGVARYKYNLKRREDGTLHLQLVTEDTGEAADRRRGTFSGTQDPRRYAAWLQSQFPGADLIGEPVIDLRPGRNPATMKLEAEVSRTALLGMGGLAVFPGEVDWASRLVPAGSRSGPLQLPVTPDLEWSLEVELGRPPRELPEDVEIDSRFGTLDLEVVDQGNGYRIEGSFHLGHGLVEAHEAPGLREFLLEVRQRLSRTLEVP